MVESLSEMLQQPIDYAGMFPPAKLELGDAVDEYITFMESEDAWIANRFIVGQGNLVALRDFWADSREFEEDLLPVVVVGPPLGSEATSTLTALQKLETECQGVLEVSGFEAKVEPSSLKPVKKQLGWFLDNEVELFLECGWDEGFTELMGETVSVLEEVGIKARMGGTEAAAFPSVELSAQFIAEAASLEVPFKFTAGLHEPLRYLDEELGCHHHGFLNVFAASILAVVQDAGGSTIAEVLSIEEARLFEFNDEGFTVLNHQVSMEDIGQWWSYFRGFGSCSLQEPIDGLNRLGLW